MTEFSTHDPKQAVLFRCPEDNAGPVSLPLVGFSHDENAN